MEYFVAITAVCAAYLLGSFSSAVWIGRWFFAKDVREYGSHNAGTTNTIRVLGTWPGVVVLFLDALKGWLSVELSFVVLRVCPSLEPFRAWLCIALAAAVVLGHVFPLYTGFRGGKGVATLLGVLMAMYPEAWVAALAVFAVVFVLTRYVSLGSVCAAVAFPLLDIFVFSQEDPVLRVFSVCLGVFLVFMHRKNIGRLIRGEESRLCFRKKPGVNPNLAANQAPARNYEEAIARLFRILKLLRKQCPWDKKQTFESLRSNTIEETFELSDALVVRNFDEIKKELGDVLLHIAFYSDIAEDQGRFTFTDVCNSLCEKLIRRHPHIFSDERADDEEAVKEKWEAIKLKEGKKHSVLSGVPSSLPAMIKAYRIQDKARGVGFDWDEPEQCWDKVLEEIDEFRAEVVKWKDLRGSVEKDVQEAALLAADAGEEVSGPSRAFLEQRRKTLGELGDVFFALINYARLVKLNPEDALEQTNRKFIDRFTYMEERTIGQGLDLHNMSLEEMDKYWEEAKKALK